MRIEFDPEKSKKNIRERRLPFSLAYEFDWETAIFKEDNRKVYPEKRFVAFGYLHDRLHVLCFTHVDDGVRVISFRKANSREVKMYEKENINN